MLLVWHAYPLFYCRDLVTVVCAQAFPVRRIQFPAREYLAWLCVKWECEGKVHLYVQVLESNIPCTVKGQ